MILRKSSSEHWFVLKRTSTLFYSHSMRDCSIFTIKLKPAGQHLKLSLRIILRGKIIVFYETLIISILFVNGISLFFGIFVNKNWHLECLFGFRNEIWNCWFCSKPIQQSHHDAIQAQINEVFLQEIPPIWSF